MMDGYIRCHYTSPDGIECGSWFPQSQGNLCVVHRDSVSLKLAANGINKPEYLSARKETETSLRDQIAGKTPHEACGILDAHIAAIEKIIEDEKLKHATAKALRGEVIDGMSAEEIQLRRQMKMPKSESTSKKSSGKLKGSPDEMIAQMMKKWPSMTREGAMKMLGLG